MSEVFDNEFLLQDRIQKIQQVIGKYGEENFYISFSGGKDSTVLSALVDMAVPGNKIPRVYCNTGIELNMIRDFVKELAQTDDRIVIIMPSIPIKPMLERCGYPFKSKHHSEAHRRYKSNPDSLWVKKYVDGFYNWHANQCPAKLKYQFTKDFDRLKISDECCLNLKERPIDNWAKENNKPHGIIGLMHEEGGRRQSAKCMAFRRNKLWHFQPLVPVSKEWEEWFIASHNIKICDIYNDPYNIPRTGCKGCPFSPKLQAELDMLEQFFPAERKQCEIIWKPVYDEYRRIGYRLKDGGYCHQLSFKDYYSEDQMFKEVGE